MLFMVGATAVLVVLMLVIATRPASFHVERSTTIAASPERLFAQVNDFHAWRAWSPYEALDPQLKRTYEGPASGVGARYGWSGNAKAGEGRMTIIASEPPARVGIKLEFLKPFAAVSEGTFSFIPTPSGTRVTWAMDGQNGFMAKAFSMVVNMDKLVGGDFERGLAAMKALAEAGSARSGATH